MEKSHEWNYYPIMLNKHHGCSLFKSNKHQWFLNSVTGWIQCAKGENRRNGQCIHAAGAGDSMELTLGQYTCDSRGRFAAA